MRRRSNEIVEGEAFGAPAPGPAGRRRDRCTPCAISSRSGAEPATTYRTRKTTTELRPPV